MCFFSDMIVEVFILYSRRKKLGQTIKCSTFKNKIDLIIIFLEVAQFAPNNVIICSNTMRLDLDKISENLPHKEVIKNKN